jgi:hypothetical protein
VSLSKKLVWEQEEQILDLAIEGDAMLVLGPSRVVLLARYEDRWEPRATARLTQPGAWPRDLRGRLRLSVPHFDVFLPGIACQGTTEPELTLDCRPGDRPWPLASGSRATLAANFAAGRNYFDGRVTMPTGAAHTAPPFFSAAAIEERAATDWVLALADGRTELFDSSFNTLAPLPTWGSDVAGIDARCGGPSQVLATRASDTAEPDAIQSWTIVDRAASPATAPLPLPGPVTALWPAAPDAALAVVRNLSSGRYEAYVVTLVCGQ